MMEKNGKVLTFSFDDGEIHDRRLAEMFRSYGAKATFYLITDQMGARIPHHRYGEDLVVERTCAAEIPETYRGMEVASHTRAHRLPPDHLADEVLDSINQLASWSGKRVMGMAYPGGAYTQTQVAELSSLGLRFARGAHPTHAFSLPTQWLAWQPTCHYADAQMPELIRRFLDDPDARLFHIFGHSYELTQKDSTKDWNALERTLSLLTGRRDLLYATNGEAALHFQGERAGNIV